jgi:hypothetical protein
LVNNLLHQVLRLAQMVTTSQLDVAPAALMRTVCSCQSVGALADVWQHNASQFNTRHLSAALLRLAHIFVEGDHTVHRHNKQQQQQQQVLVVQLITQIRQRLRVLDCCGLSNVLQALGMMAPYCSVPPSFVAELVDAVAVSMSAFSLQQLTAVVRGLAQLQHRPDSGWRFSFFAVTLQMAQSSSSASGIPASCVAGCLWAWARLNTRPPPGWLASLLNAADIDGARPGELSGMVHALGRLGYEPAPGWLERLQARSLWLLQQRPATPASRWRLADVLQLAWGLARLRAPVSPAWLEAWGHHVRHLLPESAPPELIMALQALATATQRPLRGQESELHVSSSALAQSVLAQLCRCLPELCVRDASLCLLYCARMRLRPHPVVVSALLAHLQPSLERAGAREAPSPANVLDVAHTAYSLGRLGVRPIPSSFKAALLSASSRYFSAAGPQELANMCWGIARMGARPSEKWLQQACAAIVASAERLASHEINQLAWAVRALLRGRGSPTPIGSQDSTAGIATACAFLARSCQVTDLAAALGSPRVHAHRPLLRGGGALGAMQARRRRLRDVLLRAGIVKRQDWNVLHATWRRRRKHQCTAVKLGMPNH